MTYRMAAEVFASTTESFTLDILSISDETVTIFTWVVIAGLCQAVVVFGIGTNVINIMCFVKQGFIEPVNISLLGLAICDLGCLVTLLGLNTGYTLIVGAPSADYEPVELIFMLAGMPHLSFSRVNCWITAFITLERCLCVTVPLKIKSIVTPRRVWIIISSIFIIFLFSGAPVYFVNWLGFKFSAAKNRTVLGLVFSANKFKVEGITFAINSFILPFAAFIVIITCTIVLVVNLRKKGKWRKAATQTDLSTRETKVAKMVVMISTLFIFCFIPTSVNMLAIAFEPRLNIGGKYINISTMLANIGFLLESVNSSMNILIYYHMSGKYRDTFRSMFQRNGSKSLLGITEL